MEDDLKIFVKNGRQPKKAIKKWIDNPHFNLDKLRFAMRVTTIASKNHIRDTLYPWMSLNKSFLLYTLVSCLISDIHGLRTLMSNWAQMLKKCPALAETN